MKIGGKTFLPARKALKMSGRIPEPISEKQQKIWGEAQVPPFLEVPPFYKAPPRQFQPPKCKPTPSKIQIGEGRFLCISIQELQVGGRQSLFGGCQFTFWSVSIYFLEAEIVLGVLYIRARQRSGKGVVWRNSCPKGCFWRVRFFFAPLRVFQNISGVLRANLKGAETTVSPHDAFAAPLAHSDYGKGVIQVLGLPAKTSGTSFHLCKPTRDPGRGCAKHAREGDAPDGAKCACLQDCLLIRLLCVHERVHIALGGPS